MIALVARHGTAVGGIATLFVSAALIQSACQSPVLQQRHHLLRRSKTQALACCLSFAHYNPDPSLRSRGRMTLLSCPEPSSCRGAPAVSTASGHACSGNRYYFLTARARLTSTQFSHSPQSSSSFAGKKKRQQQEPPKLAVSCSTCCQRRHAVRWAPWLGCTLPLSSCQDKQGIPSTGRGRPSRFPSAEAGLQKSCASQHTSMAHRNAGKVARRAR